MMMKRPARLLGSLVIAVIAFTASANVEAGPGFDACAAAFPGGDIDRAPKRTKPTAATKADSVPICYHHGPTTFFAVDYSPKRLTAHWVAYRLEDSFGDNGCTSGPRKQMQCYFKVNDVAACSAKTSGPGDPFHPDATLAKLKEPRLGVGAYSGTGHDRGHLAPNQSFSWHICGAYKTFTMANMAPQLAELNQRLWAKLEAQVLFWAVEEGPLHVVTGTTFTAFPADKFQVIKLGKVDKSTIVKPNTVLKEGAGGVAGKIVKPTGFYKVLFRPGRDGDQDRAVGFLVPHTTEEMNAANFRQFVARIDVIEKAGGFAFSVPEALKGGSGQMWWLERKAPTNWLPRSKSCPDNAKPEGWQPELSVDDRIGACQRD